MADDPRPVAGGLRRALGLWMLVFYGLGTIVGAGIYLLIGEVSRDAGMAMPLAFAAAGILAALTGLSYAELAARFPEAAGASAYVAEGLGSRFAARMTGFLVLFTGIVVAASLALGGAGYLVSYIDLPLPLLAAGLVCGFTALACLNVRGSVGLTAALTVIEVAGLVLVIAAGAPALAELPKRAEEIWPAGGSEWGGVATGAFAAFFAYIGFESLANMAGEAEDPHRNMPRAIILSISISSLLYVCVAVVTVLAVEQERLSVATVPLALVMERSNWGSAEILFIFALIAIPNGLLADILMTSRLLYGMGRRNIAPAWLTATSASQVPVAATITVGIATLIFTSIVPFGGLVTGTSALSLLIFLMVNLSLWRIHRRHARHPGFRVPNWMPPVGAALCAGLLLAEAMAWLA